MVSGNQKARNCSGKFIRDCVNDTQNTLECELNKSPSSLPLALPLSRLLFLRRIYDIVLTELLTHFGKSFCSFLRTQFMKMCFKEIVCPLRGHKSHERASYLTMHKEISLSRSRAYSHTQHLQVVGNGCTKHPLCAFSLHWRRTVYQHQKAFIMQDKLSDNNSNKHFFTEWRHTRAFWVHFSFWYFQRISPSHLYMGFFFS